MLLGMVNQLLFQFLRAVHQKCRLMLEQLSRGLTACLLDGVVRILKSPMSYRKHFFISTSGTLRKNKHCSTRYSNIFGPKILQCICKIQTRCEVQWMGGALISFWDEAKPKHQIAINFNKLPGTHEDVELSEKQEVVYLTEAPRRTSFKLVRRSNKFCLFVIVQSGWNSA